MPPPYVMGPQMQGAFDSTLGRLELLVLLAGSLVARDDASDSDSDDADSDSDSEEPTEERTLMAVLTMHAARRLRASAALNLGGRTRVTDAYAFDEHTCRRLFRFSAPQLEELTERMGLNAFGPKIVVGHDVFAPQEALLITLYKLAFTARLITMAQFFNRHPATLSRAFNFVVGLYTRRFSASASE